MSDPVLAANACMERFELLRCLPKDRLYLGNDAHSQSVPIEADQVCGAWLLPAGDGAQQGGGAAHRARGVAALPAGGPPEAAGRLLRVRRGPPLRRQKRQCASVCRALEPWNLTHEALSVGHAYACCAGNSGSA